jgi:hypothetical protein
MWASMMLDYAAQERIFELEVSNKTLASPLFTNANINRKLSTETLLAIIDEMVSNGNHLLPLLIVKDRLSGL